MKKIGVIGIQGGWSSEKLADALYNLTGFRLLVDIGQVFLDLNTNAVLYQGIDLNSLDGLVIKKLGVTYSADLLDRLDTLRFLEARGMPIFPSTQSIRNLLNRLSCTITLRLGGIPMPPTIITEDPELAIQALNKMGRGILKPLYSTKAEGMRIVEVGPQARYEIIHFQKKGHQTIYLQRLATLPGYDLGVVFLGGKYLATYARIAHNNSWNTSTRTGGKYFPYKPSAKIIELAYKSQALFKLNYTCVDIAETCEGPMIFEVSAFGGFRGLLDSANLDAAKLYANYILTNLSN